MEILEWLYCYIEAKYVLLMLSIIVFDFGFWRHDYCYLLILVEHNLPLQLADNYKNSIYTYICKHMHL